MRWEQIEVGKTYWMVTRPLEEESKSHAVIVRPVRVESIHLESQSVMARLGSRPPRRYFQGVYVRWRLTRPYTVKGEDGRIRIATRQEKLHIKMPQSIAGGC